MSKLDRNTPRKDFSLKNIDAIFKKFSNQIESNHIEKEQMGLIIGVHGDLTFNKTINRENSPYYLITEETRKLYDHLDRSRMHVMKSNTHL